MPRPSLLLVALALTAALSACGSDKEKTPRKGAATTATAGRSRPTATTAGGGGGGCRSVSRPRPRRAQRIPRPTLRLNPRHRYRATVDTNCGRFTITLDVEHAPRTTASFVYLARRGFYDGTGFHRIVPGFVIQGGDPRGTGQGGPGYSVVERPPDDTEYTRGVVAMAKTATDDPGTSGSQFFVVTGTDAQLPPEYAVPGKVTSGIDVVETIASEPVDATNPNPDLRERPKRPVVIRAVTISESK